MGRRDAIHNAVRMALENDGWTILKDPLSITVDGSNRRIEIDLSAEKILLAEKGIEKIAVEIKSFLGISILNEFNSSLGQYISYRDILNDYDYEEKLYLAISNKTYQEILFSSFMQRQIKRYHLKLIIIDISTKKIQSWVK